MEYQDGLIKEGKKNQFEIIGCIETPTIEVTKYIGQKTMIGEIEEHFDSVIDKKRTPFIKLLSLPLDTLDDGKELKASKILGLRFNDQNQICWFKDGKTYNFLKAQGVQHFQALIGKPIIIQATEPNKEGKRYLTF